MANVGLQDILERSGKRTAKEVEQLINEVSKILSDERSSKDGNLEIDGNLVRMHDGGKAIFVGDLHGDFQALTEILQQTDFVERVQEKKIYLVTLGDYMDRATTPEQNFQVMETLMELKKLFPDKVVLLRGNHETEDAYTYEPDYLPYGLLNSAPLVYHEMADEIIEKYSELFKKLYTAVFTDNGTFAIHGGIPIGGCSLEEIANAEEGTDLYFRLLWNDPTEQSLGDRGGEYQQYSKEDVEKFMKKNNLKKLIRAHQPVLHGVKDVYGNGLLMNVFSNNDYYSDRTGAVGFLEIEI